MVFAFDPRKLVDAEKKKKQEEEEEGIKKVSFDEEKAKLVKFIGTHNQKNSIADKYIQDLREIAGFFMAGETVPSDFNSIVNECFYEFLSNVWYPTKSAINLKWYESKSNSTR